MDLDECVEMALGRIFAMSETPQRRMGATFWTTLALFLALFAYPLSVGPVFLLIERDVITEAWDPAVDIYLKPLDWAASRSRIVRRAMTWYMGLWVEPDTSPKPQV